MTLFSASSGTFFLIKLSWVSAHPRPTSSWLMFMFIFTVFVCVFPYTRECAFFSFFQLLFWTVSCWLLGVPGTWSIWQGGGVDTAQIRLHQTPTPALFHCPTPESNSNSCTFLLFHSRIALQHPILSLLSQSRIEQLPCFSAVPLQNNTPKSRTFPSVPIKTRITPVLFCCASPE